MWDKIKEYIVPSIIIVLLVLILLSQCNGSRDYKVQLDSLQSIVDDLGSTATELRDRTRQQESVISQLAECQSQLESTVGELGSAIDELNRNEQTVDGSIGSVRATVKQLTDTIDLTLRGIEETGIQ